MKKTFLLFLFCLFGMNYTAYSAEKADWYLYVWSESTSGDWGQFETTSDANVFVIPTCEVTVNGIKFCVRNGDWTAKYGWKSESVTATGTEVELAASDGANGWLTLPTGIYKVTFNASALTIRFDEPDEEEVDPDHQEGTFLRGGDLSMVTYLEDWGAVYKYKNGETGDVFDIMSNYGINLARLRLYHTPGTGVKAGGSTYRTPVMSPYNNWEGRLYAGPDDILSLAKRAKAHSMQICLSIYLSDYWAGATEQYIPGAWAQISTNSVLADSVENHVKGFMQRLADEGIYPEYVSIGNESNYGILFTNLNGNKVSFGGHTDNISQCVTLFNRAYDAVKAVSPTTKVIIHHSYGDAGKIAICRSFFQNLKNNGCKFDVVGGSYYPYWADNHGASDSKPTGMLTWAKDMKDNIGKPVMLMEVGYSWTPYKSEGRNGGQYEGQLHLNGSQYNEASEAGQEAFIKELHEALKTDENIIGYMYWDPIFVDQLVDGTWIKTCWAEEYSGSGDTWWEKGNVISNTTLFNYEGKPLSALYNEIASYKTPNPTTGTDNNKTETVVRKVVRDGQLLIEREGKTYNVLGTKVK